MRSCLGPRSPLICGTFVQWTNFLAVAKVSQILLESQHRTFFFSGWELTGVDGFLEYLLIGLHHVVDLLGPVGVFHAEENPDQWALVVFDPLLVVFGLWFDKDWLHSVVNPMFHFVGPPKQIVFLYSAITFYF